MRRRLRRDTAEKMIYFTDISPTDDRHVADSEPLAKIDTATDIECVITASIDRQLDEVSAKSKILFTDYRPIVD